MFSCVILSSIALEILCIIDERNKMEAIYPYMLTLHLLCAIIFLGFIFTDVVLLSPLKKALGDELADKIFSIVSKRGVKVMPLCLLLLLLSGGAMISRYVGTTQGFFDFHLDYFRISVQV